jgi:endo-alpha-1,4-polygalactosaminidase (GH114 family)
LPPANGGLDYQLGGAYDPPDGVQVLSRDRNDSPAAGLYNICYVNGYQTQPDEEQWWLDEHPDLLLRDGDGDPFIDPDWDEILLDITTPAKREALAEIVGSWIVQCGDDGFDGVEIDNLDTYSRSDGLISQDDAVAYMSLLSAVAHGEGMAIAQKNSTEILDRQGELGTDFAVAEECNRWDECADYIDVYGDQVYVIEYRQQDFNAGCADFPELSIVLRDLDLVPSSSGGYVYDAC